MIQKITLIVLNICDFFHKKKIFKFLKSKNLTNFNIFFDVGAHTGETILSFGKNLNLKYIYSFEASPITYHILNKNLKKIQSTTPYSQIYIENLAVGSSNKKIKLQGDYCLISIGRRPYTDSLNLDSIGVETSSNGQIKVNKSLMTSQSNIYAIGDVVEGTMLAHKAEEEGVFVAELISGQKPQLHHHLIPNVVYTWPEVASVGFTEEELRESGKKIKINYTNKILSIIGKKCILFFN